MVMSNVVIIGAGQTGRGYLNRFFQMESITFLDKDEELIHALQTELCYHVSFGPGARKPLELENYNAYLIDSEDGLQAMADADLIMISVGKKNLKDVAVEIKKALTVRTKDDIDILTAENGVNVKQDLLGLCEDERVHLAEAIVFCTTIGEKWSLDILSQNLDYLPYDVVSLGHTLPYENMVAEEKLDVLMQRKIYTYNCISAVISYLGYYKKYEVYSDAANDPEIVTCIGNILKTLNHCICEEYHIAAKEQKEFSDMAVDKFQNRNIVDSIERNARDVDRKLSASERIMAPLAIIHKHEQKSPELLLTAASALYYGKMTKTLLKPESEYIADLPEEWQTEIRKDLEALEEKNGIADILK